MCSRSGRVQNKERITKQNADLKLSHPNGDKQTRMLSYYIRVMKKAFRKGREIYFYKTVSESRKEMQKGIVTEGKISIGSKSARTYK